MTNVTKAKMKTVQRKAGAPTPKPAARAKPLNPRTASVAELDKAIAKMSVPSLIKVRDALRTDYLEARLDESVPANRLVLRKWDAVEWRIEQLSGPSGGE